MHGSSDSMSATSPRTGAEAAPAEERKTNGRTSPSSEEHQRSVVCRDLPLCAVDSWHRGCRCRKCRSRRNGIRGRLRARIQLELRARLRPDSGPGPDSNTSAQGSVRSSTKATPGNVGGAGAQDGPGADDHGPETLSDGHGTNSFSPPSAPANDDRHPSRGTVAWWDPRATHRHQDLQAHRPDPETMAWWAPQATHRHQDLQAHRPDPGNDNQTPDHAPGPPPGPGNDNPAPAPGPADHGPPAPGPAGPAPNPANDSPAPGPDNDNQTPDHAPGPPPGPGNDDPAPAPGPADHGPPAPAPVEEPERHAADGLPAEAPAAAARRNPRTATG